MGVEFTQIVEGKAKLFVPKDSFNDPFHLPVFFNPAMEFNRSISVLALTAIISSLKLNEIVGVDGLCATGARGVRYLLEAGVANWKEFSFVDANPDAMAVLKKNVKKNFSKKDLTRIRAVESDFNKFLCNSEKFDFIEIDPFGSPVFFLENALRRCSKKAVLSVTATDLASLCGAMGKAGERHYDAKPLRSDFSHEVALRILIGKIARVAVQNDFGIKPLFSFYNGHYIKTFILVEKSADKANLSLEQLGFVSYCTNCLDRQSVKLPEKTCSCGNRLLFGGKLWVSGMSDLKVLGAMFEIARKDESIGSEVRGFVSKILEETSLSELQDVPHFFDLHAVAKKFRFQVPSVEKVMGNLKSKGLVAVRTHFSPTAIKTNANIQAVKNAMLNQK